MNKTLFSVVVIVFVAAIGSGVYFGNQSQTKKTTYIKQLEIATVLPQPRVITSFHLINNKGKPFSNKNLIGHWTMFFFGFTHCGYVCPTTMVELKGAYKILKQKKS